MQIRKYAVIGHPIGHTMSPFIHSKLFDISNISAEYSVLDIKPEDLQNQFNAVLSHLDGFNITIPHKQNIISCIDELDDKAKMYGSVNTVSIKDGHSKGFTTDPDGFIKALDSVGIELSNRVVILGCGGVARTMAYEAVLNNSYLTLAIRKEDITICKTLCNEIKNTIPDSKINFCTLEELSGDIDVLINATPVGMFPKSDAQPVADDIIAKSAAVFDAVYNPLQTVLIKKALSNGSRAIGGMSMLVWQAVVAHQIWDGSTYDVEQVNRICNEASQELLNK